jgi:hypothetical protein
MPGVEDGERVRVKRHQGETGEVSLFAVICGQGDDLLMAEVNAVEVADAEDAAGRQFGKL